MLSYTPFRDLKIIRLIKSIIRFVKRYRFELSIKKLSKKIRCYNNLSTIPLTYSLIQYEKYADELVNSIDVFTTDEEKIFSIIECMKNHNDMVALNRRFENKVYELTNCFFLGGNTDFITQLNFELNSDAMYKLVSVIKTKIK